MSSLASRWFAIGTAAVFTVVSAISLQACSSPDRVDRTAKGAIDAFAAAMDKQNAQSAAALTTSPADAGDLLGGSFAAMHAKEVTVTPSSLALYSDGSATFSIKTTWTFGPGRQWATESQGAARKLTVGWRVQWDPQLLAPGLTQDGLLREVKTYATPVPMVRDTAGKPLMNLETVNDLIVNPDQIKDPAVTGRQLSRVVAPVAPLATADELTRQITGSGAKPVTVVSIRDSDFGGLNGDPTRVPGVTLQKRQQLVLINRELRSPLLDGVTDYWNALADATSGWAVEVVNPGQKPVRMSGAQGPAAPDVRTTFDPAAQAKVKRAVVEVAQPAAMLAMDANSGALLGAAQNDAAAAQNIGLTDDFTSGHALDPVVAAVRQAGGGDINRENALMDQLGLGLSFTVPGVRPASVEPSNNDTFSMAALQVNPASNTASAAKSVSAINMAAMAASVTRGATVTPYVINGLETKVEGGAPGAIDAGVLASIRSAMAATVKTGDASDLRRDAGLTALVGTNGPQGPGWFVGVRNGVAVAIYCAGAKSGTAALQVMQRYLNTP
jgi:hypothetical protein